MKAEILVLASCIAWPAAVAGQPANPPDPPALAKVIDFFQQPVHPVVQTVAPGGGIGGGIGYRPKEFWETRGFASVDGVFTVNQYWRTQAHIGVQEGRYHVEAYAQARDMKQLDVYGLGNDSVRSNRTSFRLQDRGVGGIGSVRFGLVAVGGRAESLWFDVMSGTSRDYPSVEQRFTETLLPGLVAQPRFTHYQTSLNVNYPIDLNARGFTGGDYRVAYSFFQDGARGQYSFRRLMAEAQQRIAGLREDQRLTLHGLVSTSDADEGKAVPFYLQETLGGAGAVRGFHDEIIGSDGSKATMRGFQDLRFRGPHLLLLQAEYRFGIWGPLDGTVFVDAGKVTSARRDLNLTHLKRDVGFSVSLMTGDATALRVETGFGGREGTHVFFSIGPIWAQ